MNLDWLAFDPATAQSLSWLCLVLFGVVVGICGFLLLGERSTRTISWLTATVMVVCVVLSFLTSTLYYWHFFFRER